MALGKWTKPGQQTPRDLDVIFQQAFGSSNSNPAETARLEKILEGQYRADGWSPVEEGAPDGGTPSGGGTPSTPSIDGLKDAAAGMSGSGAGEGGSQTPLHSPSKFRQNIGQRIMPQQSQSLAALKQVY